MSISLKKRIQEMGLVLPQAPKPAGLYRHILIVGNELYV